MILNNPKEISHSLLFANPSSWAYEMIKNIEISMFYMGSLSENNSKWAYNMLKQNINKISWRNFNNPYIFKINKSVSKNSYKLFDKLLYEIFKN